MLHLSQVDKAKMTSVCVCVLIQENEKLYLQVKALQAQNKHNEKAMFTENQRLHHELAIAR